jgi:hypothetical protein
MKVFIMLVTLFLFLISLWFVFNAKKNKLFNLSMFVLINGAVIPFLLYKSDYGDFIVYEMIFAFIFILPELFSGLFKKS